MSTDKEIREIIGEELDARNRALARKAIGQFFLFMTFKWAVIVGLSVLARKLFNSKSEDRTPNK